MFKIILIRLKTNSFANLFLIGCPSQSKGLNSSWVGLVDNRRLYPLPQMDMSEPRMGKNWTSWSLTCVSLLFLAELGDYSEAEHSPGYLSEYSFIPNPPQDFHKEVAKHHQQHRYAETRYNTPVIWYSFLHVEAENRKLVLYVDFQHLHRHTVYYGPRLRAWFPCN